MCTSLVELNRPISIDKFEFMGERKGAYRVGRENLREIHRLEFIDLDRRIKFKWIFNKLDGGMD